MSLTYKLRRRRDISEEKRYQKFGTTRNLEHNILAGGIFDVNMSFYLKMYYQINSE